MFSTSSPSHSIILSIILSNSPTELPQWYTFFMVFTIRSLKFGTGTFSHWRREYNRCNADMIDILSNFWLWKSHMIDLMIFKSSTGSNSSLPFCDLWYVTGYMLFKAQCINHLYFVGIFSWLNQVVYWLSHQLDPVSWVSQKLWLAYPGPQLSPFSAVEQW